MCSCAQLRSGALRSSGFACCLSDDGYGPLLQTKTVAAAAAVAAAAVAAAGSTDGSTDGSTVGSTVEGLYSLIVFNGFNRFFVFSGF